MGGRSKAWEAGKGVDDRTKERNTGKSRYEKYERKRKVRRGRLRWRRCRQGTYTRKRRRKAHEADGKEKRLSEGNNRLRKEKKRRVVQEAGGGNDF